jgi:hypothetical protein
MKTIVDFDATNRAAIPVLHAVLARLLPGGTIIAGEYVVRNPKPADKHAGSFKINLRSGRWADFATGDRGGDVVSLIAFLEDIPQADAARLLGKMLGLEESRNA